MSDTELKKALLLARNRTLHNSTCSKIKFQRSRKYRPGGGEESCSCGAGEAQRTIDKAIEELNTRADQPAPSEPSDGEMLEAVANNRWTIDAPGLPKDGPYRIWNIHNELMGEAPTLREALRAAMKHQQQEEKR